VGGRNDAVASDKWWSLVDAGCCFLLVVVVEDEWASRMGTGLEGETFLATFTGKREISGEKLYLPKDEGFIISKFSV
jgi:hypothetical protein